MTSRWDGELSSKFSKSARCEYGWRITEERVGSNLATFIQLAFRSAWFVLCLKSESLSLSGNICHWWMCVSEEVLVACPSEGETFHFITYHQQIRRCHSNHFLMEFRSWIVDPTILQSQTQHWLGLHRWQLMRFSCTSQCLIAGWRTVSRGTQWGCWERLRRR